ncbi:hypothetical protein EXIGLDRAFT_735566, partial [Exidia glandulosa HHB12029]
LSMDSIAYTAAEDVPVVVDEEKNPGSTAYCVVCAKPVDVPVSEDHGGGSTAYCVVA